MLVLVSLLLENKVDEFGTGGVGLVVLLVLPEEPELSGGVPTPRSLLFCVSGMGVYPSDFDSVIEPDGPLSRCGCCFRHGGVYFYV